jgi:polyhydroxyalkanoate depolymerase
LMAGPIDTGVNPTKVNKLATRRPISWFEHSLIAEVPLGYKGARRRVYPGFMQLAAFMSMNPERHLRSFEDMAEARAASDQSNPRRAGALHGIAATYEGALRADGSWPLRSLWRPPLEQRSLSEGA